MENHEITNTLLMQNGSTDEFKKMGFIECYDGVPMVKGQEPESAWGISYEMETELFEITIDCTFVVHLNRKDSDQIWIHIPDLVRLQELIDFIQ